MTPLYDPRTLDAALQRLAEKAAQVEAELEAQRDRMGQLEAEYRDAIARLKAAQAAKARAEEAAHELVNLLGAELLEDDEPAPAKTNFDRIVDFFAGRDNRPQTIAEIEAGTGIPRSSISAVLYRTHPERFTQYEHPGKQANTWRLKGYGFKNGDDDPFDGPSPNTGEDIPF